MLAKRVVRLDLSEGHLAPTFLWGVKTEEEKEKFSSQLGDVMKYFDKLNAVEVDGVEPTAHAFPRHNVWDDDQSKPGFSSEEALMNAPEKRQDQVVVPKVIEE